MKYQDKLQAKLDGVILRASPLKRSGIERLTAFIMLAESILYDEANERVEQSLKALKTN